MNQQPQPLRVKSVPGAMVQDYRAMMRAKVRRFIGVSHDASLGENGGWRWSDEVVEIPSSEFDSEYLRHLRDGSLVAADEATAKRADIPWRPPAPTIPAGPDAKASAAATSGKA